MKARLLFRDRDFDWRTPLLAATAREAARHGRHYRGPDFDAQAGLPWNADALTADLALDTLFEAMARGDDCLWEVARKVVLAGTSGDLATIRYRQAVLQDCLTHPAVVRELYAVAVAATAEEKRHHFASYLARYPESILRNSIDLMSALLEASQRLRKIADSHGQAFASEGWRAFFATLEQALDDEYFDSARRHLKQLRLRDGVLLSATLGKGNRGSNYVLRRFSRSGGWWLERWWNGLVARLRRLLHHNHEAAPPARFRPPASPVYSFSLHPRDEAGARALAELRNRGVALVADALAQSAEHVRDFFAMLQAELAFYVGCVNLHETLARQGGRVCMPLPAAAAERRMTFRGLYDPCLALTLGQGVSGNDANADGKDLVIVTGANQGGKSTFLRSVGLAQLMMQCGLFVPADEFAASLCDGLFSHYKREEDAGMTSGKLAEELGRMSDIVDHVRPRSLILSNESFAATNEREGSEIARQIIAALLGKHIRIVCVTHLYELARGFYERNIGNVLFLRAERARTFILREGEPLPTSFGTDLYDAIFATDSDRLAAGGTQI